MSVDPSRSDWQPDLLGHPYEHQEIDLGSDDEGPVMATLVRRPTHGATNCAVLHVHGFADYFFQTEYAEWWTDRGYTFYALDLRKYGRSLRPHQTANYMSDVRDYFPELDEAHRRITEVDGHEAVVLSAHSTGGLTVPLWLDDRRPAVSGMVLNAPWLDFQAGWLVRTLGTAVVSRVGARNPKYVIPRSVSGFYAASLHTEHEGEWDFDLAWKPLHSWPTHAGWLRAVRAGHARLQRGLDVDTPTLVLASDRSTRPSQMGEDVHSSDIVLDVAQIRRWSTAVSSHVTMVTVPGARHDVLLSRAEPRTAAYDQLDRWLAAYVER